MSNKKGLSKLVFLDTETTGNEDKDHLCSVAFKREGHPIVNAFFKPPLPISLEAMAVTHITNKMVADKPVFQGSPEWKTLKEWFEEEDCILVAHNAEFDRKMLVKEGIEISADTQVICTMKVVRHFDTRDKIPNYKMQYVRYFMELEMEATAHDAADDIKVLEAIFFKLYNQGITIDKMLQITREPFLLRKLTFGKHKGEPFNVIPRDYLIWLRRQDKIEGDLLYTLNYYINKNGAIRGDYE